MKAVVTAEMPQWALVELRRLGFDPLVTGWGTTRQTLSEQELIQTLQDATVLICELEDVTERVLEECPKLSIVISCRANPVNVDLPAAEKHSVWVLNAPGRNADSVADFTIGLILASERRMVSSHQHLRTDGWHVDGELPYFHFRGHEIARRTVGLLGCGAIGQRVAKRLIDGFDTTVIAHDPYVTRMPAGVEAVGFDELFVRADIVSLHAPGSTRENPLVGMRELTALGPEGILVNTARAALVDESALVQAIRDGALGGAALDVFWTEPIPPGHPLLTFPNVITTPHVAGAALNVADHHARLALDGISAIQRAERPSNAVVRGASYNAGKGTGSL